MNSDQREAIGRIERLVGRHWKDPEPPQSAAVNVDAGFLNPIDLHAEFPREYQIDNPW